MQGNAAGAWAQTFWTDAQVPTFTNLNNNTLHFGYYNTGPDGGSSSFYGTEIGAEGGGVAAGADLILQLDDTAGAYMGFYGRRLNAIGGESLVGSYMSGNAIAGQATLFKNGVAVTAPGPTTAAPINAYVALNSVGSTNPAVRQTAVDYDSNRRCGFAVIGNGLTNTDVLNDYQVIEAFQVALGRENASTPITISVGSPTPAIVAEQG